jgi:hypothetical protein
MPASPPPAAQPDYSLTFLAPGAKGQAVGLPMADVRVLRTNARSCRVPAHWRVVCGGWWCEATGGRDGVVVELRVGPVKRGA